VEGGVHQCRTRGFAIEVDLPYDLTMIRYFVGFALLIAIVPAHVFGCSCAFWGAERPCPLMKSATEVMFIGTLLSSENPPESGTVAGQTGQARYTFQVEEAFSGVTTKAVDVYSGRGCCDCSVRFQLGEKYLVDGWRGNNGSVSVSICSKTRLFRASDPLLPELRAIRDGKKPDSWFGVLRRDQEPWGGASDPDYDRPLGGNSIRLQSEEQTYQAKSDPDGNYRFPDLLPGEYSVSVDLPPNLVLGQQILSRPMSGVVVAADACGEYNLHALPTGQISGRIVSQTGSGVSGWNATDIQLFRAERYKENASGWNDRGWWAFPKDGGYFVFDHVAPGDYIVVYNYNNRIDGGRPYPRTFYPSAADPEHARRIHVGEGEKVTDIIVRVVAKSTSQE